MHLGAMVREFDPLEDQQPAQRRRPAADGGLLDLPLGEDELVTAPVADETPAWEPRHRRRRRRPRLWPWLVLLLVAGGAAAAWHLVPRGEPAVIEPAVAELGFGARPIGGAGEPLELVLSNRGERPLRVRRFEVAGEAAELFTVAAEACSGRAVAAGESCRLAIEYRPRESGEHRALLRVVARAANSPLELPLIGRGVAPRLEPEPAELAFAALPVGGRSAAARLRLESVGDAPVRVGAVELVGPAAGDFRVERDRCSERELAAQAHCELQVAFAPAAEGARRAELRVVSDAVTGAVVVALAGGGLPPPRVALEPSRLVFDEQLVGERSAAQALTLRNRGGERLRLGVARLGGDGADFTLAADRCSSRELAPGAECTIEVSFAPRGEGALSRQLELPQAGNTGISWRAELAGTAVAPRLEWSTERLDWGPSRVGVAGESRPLRLRNAGSGTLRLDALRLGGGDAGAFTVAGDGCAGRALERGEGCKVSVAFRASRLGEHRATLAATGRGAAGSDTVELLGDGIAGRLELSSEGLEFGSVMVSEASSREVEIANRGNAELTLQGFAAVGGAADDFRLSGDCRVGDRLPPEAVCRLVVRFAPLRAGGRLANLEITHDGVGSPARVSLSGAALPPPPAELVVEPTRLDFGEVRVGGRSEILPLTLSNTGRGRLRLLAVTVRGPHPGEFRVVPGTCEGIPYLAPGGRCGIGLRFLPAASGPRSAQIAIRHDAPGGERAVALSGIGLASGPP